MSEGAFAISKGLKSFSLDWRTRRQSSLSLDCRLNDVWAKIDTKDSMPGVFILVDEILCDMNVVRFSGRE